MSFMATVPDNSTITFAAGGCYGIDTGIEINDRTGLILEGNGAEFRALTMGGSSRRTFKMQGDRGLVLRNMTVRGSLNCADAISTCSWPAQPTNLEWQHAYSFENSHDSTLDNVKAFDVWGDFVEVHHDERLCGCDPMFGKPSTNISVLNSQFARAGRMGIAITNVDGFLLQNSSIGEVNMAAIDMELDWAGATGRNVRILNNTFGRHRFAMFANVGQGENESDVLIDGNRSTADTVTCQPIVSANVPRPGLQRTNFTITNNVFRSYGEFVNLNGITGAVIKNNTATHIVGGGCGEGAVVLVDSHNITVTDNAFRDHNVAVVSRGDLNSGVVDERNTL
ncbi:MAG TPA: hypothetical protein VNB94_02975 [Mycobacteriales bacterium]|nr:hypothetical protein [Mycobacteriales bacterium]